MTLSTALGIDIGGSAIKMALLAKGHAAATSRGEAYGNDIPKQTRQQFEALLKETGIAPADINVFGVAVAGTVNDQGLVSQAVNLPWLQGRSATQWLTESTGLDATRGVALTDATAAALAEHRLRPHPGRAIYLSLGTGLGGAVLDTGTPISITRGTPGHFGHIDVSGGDADAPITVSGGRGALQDYVGTAALRDEHDRIVPTDDPKMDRAVAALARGIRILIALYRPTAVVLLGGLMPNYRARLDDLRQQVYDHLTPVATRFDLRIGHSDPFAAAIGAATFAREQQP